MPRLHNASSVRRRGPRPSMGKSGGGGGGAAARSSSSSSRHRTPGLLSVGRGGAGTTSTAERGDIAAASGGADKSLGPNDAEDDNVGGASTGLSVGGGGAGGSGSGSGSLGMMGLVGVRKRLDASFISPPLDLPASSGSAAPDAAADDNTTGDTSALPDSTGTSTGPKQASDEVQHTASTNNDAGTNMTATDDEAANTLNHATTTTTTEEVNITENPTPSEKVTVSETPAPSMKGDTGPPRSKPSSRRRKRKVRRSSAANAAPAPPAAPAGVTSTTSTSKAADNGTGTSLNAVSKSGTSEVLAAMMGDTCINEPDQAATVKEKQILAAPLAAAVSVVAQEIAHSSPRRRSPRKKTGTTSDSRIDIAHRAAITEERPEANIATATSTEDVGSTTLNESGTDAQKRGIMGTMVLECEETGPSEPPTKKARLNVEFDLRADRSGRRKTSGAEEQPSFDDAADTGTRVPTTPSNKLKRGQHSAPDSSRSMNSVASTPSAAEGDDSSPDTPADVAHIKGLFDQLNEQVRQSREEYEENLKALDQKWQRKYTKSKQRHETKIKNFQRAYDNLSKEYDERYAKVNREKAQESASFEKKEKMLDRRIDELSIHLENRNAKLERWRSRMADAQQKYDDALEMEKNFSQRRASLDARESNLQLLEDDFESRNARLEEKNRKYMEQLRRREQELDERERRTEEDIRQKIEAEMAEKQSFRRLGQSMAKKLIGFGSGTSDSDSEPVRVQRQRLDERENELDDREEKLDTREKALKAREARIVSGSAATKGHGAVSSASKRTIAKESARKGDCPPPLSDSPASPSRRRAAGGGRAATPTKGSARKGYPSPFTDSPASRTRRRTAGGSDNVSTTSSSSTPRSVRGIKQHKKSPSTPTRTSPRRTAKATSSQKHASASKVSSTTKKPQQSKKRIVVKYASDSDSDEEDF